jgi:hypothetical protein
LRIENPRVAGSIPAPATSIDKGLVYAKPFFLTGQQQAHECGQAHSKCQFARQGQHVLTSPLRWVLPRITPVGFYAVCMCPVNLAVTLVRSHQ